MIRVERVESADAFAALAGEWDALLASSHARSVFLAWGWLHPWWRHFGEGHELRLYLARDERGALRGVAPLHVRREGARFPVRVLSFLGTERVSSDYLDFIVDRAGEEETARALWAAIAEDAAGWDQIRLSDLLDSSVVARCVLPRAEEAGYVVEDATAEYCPYSPLPASADLFKKSLGTSMRDNYRRKTQKLVGVGAAFEAAATADAMLATLDEFYDLHERRWRTKGKEGNFRHPRVRAFHSEIVRTFGADGRLRLYRLHVGGRAFAVLYGIEHRGVLFSYQTGLAPEPPDPSLRPQVYSPGVMLIGRVMEESLGRGLHEFDFLRGHEPFKFEWTKSYRTTRTATLVAPSRWRGMTRLRADAAYRSAKGAVKRVLGRRETLELP